MADQLCEPEQNYQNSEVVLFYIWDYNATLVTWLGISNTGYTF